MRLRNKAVVTALLLGLALGSQPMVASAQTATIQSERAAHPRIVHALENMQAALKEMESAADDFGGNKAAAIHDTRLAIHSLKKALYFRLRLDDAAIDLAP
jgi:hypothetical protein